MEKKKTIQKEELHQLRLITSHLDHLSGRTHKKPVKVCHLILVEMKLQHFKRLSIPRVVVKNTEEHDDSETEKDRIR